MEKNIKISRPSGEDSYKVLCAFKSANNSYIILDSKLKDANGNTVTFVCRENNGNLEYIDGDEWKNVTSLLINIVKGSNDIEFTDVQEEYKSSENIGHPIALKDAHIIALTNNYKLPEKIEIENNKLANKINNELNTIVEEIKEPEVQKEDNLANSIDSAINTDIQVPIADESLNTPAVDIPDPMIQPIPEQSVLTEPTVDSKIQDVNPIIEDEPIIENSTPVDVKPQVVISENNLPEKDMSVEEIRNKINVLCDLLIEKEKMIDAKLQVANIAYNNAQNINQMNSNETVNIADYRPEEESKTLTA